jgi:hypothetical protein
MVAEIRGCVPKLPYAYAKTLVNRAWSTVRQSTLWSFNLFTSSWASPPMVTTGTITVATGFPAITFDADAIAALNASQLANPYSLITQRQIRVASGGIYSLISYNAGTGAALLDRPWGDLGGSGLAYQLYQVYYAPPMKDFLGWMSARNVQFFYYLGLDMTRSELDARDPQRTWYQWPTEVVPFLIDARGQGTQTPSATLGYPLFELWGQPISPFTYQMYGIRRGVDLVAPTDALPVQVGEDIVMAMARVYAYEWAEANKGMTPRNVGSDFRFLTGEAAALYAKLLQQYRRQDREFVNNYFVNRDPNVTWSPWAVYNTLAGVASTIGSSSG